MPIDPELLEILVCPETQQGVRLADGEVISKLNDEIEARRLHNRGGDVVEAKIEEGLIREDGKILYIIDDSIPVMLVDQSIEIA